MPCAPAMTESQSNMKSSEPEFTKLERGKTQAVGFRMAVSQISVPTAGSAFILFRSEIDVLASLAPRSHAALERGQSAIFGLASPHKAAESIQIGGAAVAHRLADGGAAVSLDEMQGPNIAVVHKV